MLSLLLLRRLPPLQERGYNAVFFDKVRDCWARDIRTMHADSSLLFYREASRGGGWGGGMGHLAQLVQQRHCEGCLLFLLLPGMRLPPCAESEASTITGLSVEARKTRANDIPNVYNEPADADGHWGVGAQHTFDLLVDGFKTSCKVCRAERTADC